MNSRDLWDRLLLSTEIGPVSETLRKSRVLIIGAGGLGSDLALRLAGCHVSHLTLVDRDKVSIANIPHSPIFLHQHVGYSKVDVVSQFLLAKFPDLHVSVEQRFIQECNPEIFEQCDLIVCAPDNDRTRLWVNYYAVKFGRPAVFVGVSGPRAEWTGYTFIYKPGVSGCFLCLANGGEQPDVQEVSYAASPVNQDLEESRRRCGGENVPVPMLAPVVGMVASYTASVILKSITAVTDVPTYTYLNLKQPQLSVSEIKAVPTCSVCGHSEEYDVASIVTKKRNQRL